MKENIILFGASKLGKIAKEYLEGQYRIAGFCDNDRNKWGKQFEGYPVVSVDDLVDIKAKIIIASTYHSEISKQLIELGFDNFEVFSISLTRPEKLSGTLKENANTQILKTQSTDIIFNDGDFVAIYNQVKEYTMTSLERIYALYQSVKYVIENNVPGDFVECGVWRGGSAMVMALTLNALNTSTKNIYLYDTFSGMTEPKEVDVDFRGVKAKDQLLDVSCCAGLEEVKVNLRRTGYSDEKIFFIEGPVERTIPSVIPETISLLRLDTDWYESTYHELKHLYPVLSQRGVLLIDDYGHWNGAKEAVDQYFRENNIDMLLNTVDYTGRLGIKGKGNVMNCLNLGCGGHFHPDWVNVDFTQTGPGVIAHNLVEGIPFEDNTFDVVYHSHLLEHFPKIKGEEFMKECYRVLRPGGILRVAVPDLEQICRLYIDALEKASTGDEEWQHNYDWILLEMYDQCMRNYSGGEMIKYLMREPFSNEQFVSNRLGSFYQTLKGWIAPLKTRIQKENTISKTDLTTEEIGRFRKGGEIHQWMYDRYSLKRLFVKTGFRDIQLREANESYIGDWSKYCLDTEPDGTVYKADSLYMEGIK
jgi:predicted SAM-dependent methyltransferase